MNKKIKKKNQIPKYHTPCFMGTMKKIQDQLIKNLLPSRKLRKKTKKFMQYD